MSNGALFAMGALVTLIVGAALALLVYGAILDGRAAEEQKGPEAEQVLSGAGVGRRSAA